jgi:hypothetical protein
MTKKNYSIAEVFQDPHKLIVIVGQDRKSINALLTIAGASSHVIIWKNPENGLHPIKQCELAETVGIGFTRNFHNGKRLIVFTDSPYFIDHLENLMWAYRYRSRPNLSDKFLTKTGDSFIDPNNVSAYRFEDGKINQILDHRTLNVDWNTFSKVSEWVVDLKFEIRDG